MPSLVQLELSSMTIWYIFLSSNNILQIYSLIQNKFECNKLWLQFKNKILFMVWIEF